MGATTETVDDDSGGSPDPLQPKPEAKVTPKVEDVIIESAEQLEAADTKDDPPPPSDPEPGKKILKIRSDAMKEIKSKAREAGRKDAALALADQLKETGFDSLADMAAEITKLRETKAGEPASTEEKKMAKKTEDEAGQSDEELTKLRGEREAAVEAKRKANRARAREEQRRRGLQRRLDAEQAERRLEREALKAGVQDTDYALVLLRRHLKSKKESGEEDYLKDFKPGEFFAKELRDSHPHLYATVERKANTAGAADAGNGEAGDPPKDGVKPPAANGAGGKGDKDIRDMSPQEFQAELKKRGLAVPNQGF